MWATRWRWAAAVAGLAVAVGAGGCAGGDGGSGGGRSGSASGTGSSGGASGGASAQPLLPPVGTWLKGDLHVHSRHSHDAEDFGDEIDGVIALGERAGLDFLAISDHRNANCLTDPKFTGAVTPLILIPGEEWGGSGHAGAHGLTRDPIYHSQSQGGQTGTQMAIDDVHAMGGIFILNHPIDEKCPWVWPVDRFDGVEVWNTMWAMRNASDRTAAEITSYAIGHGVPQPMPETIAATAFTGGGTNWQRLKFYEAHLAAGRHIAAVGGGDSHYVVLPGQPTTVVFAEQATPAGVLEGIRKGRTMVMRAPDAPRLEFTADRDSDGIFESIVGDRIPIGGTVVFKVRVEDADGGRIELVRNGQVVQTWDVTGGAFEVAFADMPLGPSWYRVNCYEKLDMSLPQAALLKQLVLGTTNLSWLTNLTSGFLANIFGGWLPSFANDVQEIVDTGGPALVWLLIYGWQVGIQMAPVPTRYPRLEIPEAVSRILNVAVHDDEYCPGVLTSAIWVE